MTTRHEEGGLPLVEVVREADGVVRVALNRPSRMNALTPPLFDALIAAGEALARDDSVRAVVLHGNGRAFCAGLDLSNFDRVRDPDSRISPGRLAARTHGDANDFQQAVLVWQSLPVPVIAAVHGVAYGGGLQLALGADLRLVAPDAKLSMMEIRWGLVPDMAGIWLTRQLMRADQARELIYSGRIVAADEAVTIGLATRVCADPLAEALTLAAGIAASSPAAVRAAKRLVTLAETADRATVLLAEAEAQDVLLDGPEQREVIRASREGRAPVFPPAGDGTSRSA